MRRGPRLQNNSPKLHDLLVFDNKNMNSPMANNHFLFDKTLDTSANEEEILELLNAISCQQRQEKEFCIVRY